MSAPSRLLQDAAIPELAREDLLRLREHGTVPFDTAGGLVRLRESVARGTGTGAPPAPSGAAGAPTKLLAALGVVGIAGLAYLLWPSDRVEVSSHPEPARVASPQAERPRASEEGKGQGQEASVVEESEPPVLKAPVPDAPALTQRKPEGGSVGGPASALGSGKSVAIQGDPSDLLAEEIAHLAALRAAYSAGSPGAIKMAREGHQKFAGGTLYEEREALLILSLAQSGQSEEAERRARPFVERFPSSAFAPKMKQVLPGLARSPEANP